MPPAAHDSPRALIRYALVGAALTIAISWGLFLVRGSVLLIYMSALVAIGLSPLVGVIERWRMPRTMGLPRWLAILVIYLVFLGVLVGSALPRMLSDGQQWLIDRGLLNREFTFREAVEQAPVGSGGDAVGTVVTAIWGLMGGLFGFITILILSFYLLVDADNIVRTFVRLFPTPERARVEEACRRVSTKVSAWLGGQLFLAAVIGGSAAIGLFLMGVPYFYVLALIAGIGEMIPIVGPLVAAVPAVAVAFTVSPTLALGVAVFFLLQQQIENHVLVPKVMERQVGVSAVVVIIALLIGGSLLGVVGAILAVPTAAILQVLFEELGPEGAATG
jgi:predicted PurR-regulated permease PerM